VATAFSFVMAASGSGIGLSLASPYQGDSPMTHAIALALRVLWVTVSSFAAGGYVCGRLRRRGRAVSPDEAEVRDGAHGLTVRATSMLIVALQRREGGRGERRATGAEGRPRQPCRLSGRFPDARRE
jgi:hypothetical protein